MVLRESFNFILFHVASYSVFQASLIKETVFSPLYNLASFVIDLGFPGGSDGKESACNAEDLGLIPGLERSPGEGNGNPLQCSPVPAGEFHGQRNLAGYSPWGPKEADTTE